MYFKVGGRELEYLKSKDPKLGAVIDRIGSLRRPVNPDLFSSVVCCIVGQQISGRVQEVICGRIADACGGIEPESLGRLSAGEIRRFGVSYKKAENIRAFSEKILSGELDLNRVGRMPDDEVIRTLTALPGVGLWTAEMILLFTLRRPDVLSFGDLGIHRGMRMVYRHRAIGRDLFERYRRRLSPCGSAASLYFWEVAGGAIPELTDPAPRRKQAPRAV
ncbi:MAG: hypothetical protein K6E55_08145 [Thermoguttaceae bacterium]|nr:hypothetical protein [Thermoguttaceae bacterium]